MFKVTTSFTFVSVVLFALWLFLFFFFVLLVLLFVLLILFLLFLFLLRLFLTDFVFRFCFVLRIGRRPMQCKIKISETRSKGLQKFILPDMNAKRLIFLTIHVGLRHLLRMLPWLSNPVEFATYAKALLIELTTWFRSLWDQCFLQRGLPGGLWVGRPLSSRASCMHRERWSQGQTQVQLLVAGALACVGLTLPFVIKCYLLSFCWGAGRFQTTSRTHLSSTEKTFSTCPKSFCAAACFLVEKVWYMPFVYHFLLPFISPWSAQIEVMIKQFSAMLGGQKIPVRRFRTVPCLPC